MISTTEDRRAHTALSALSEFCRQESGLAADERTTLRTLMGEVALALLDINPRHTDRRTLLKESTSALSGWVGILRDAHESDAIGPIMGLIWDLLPGFNDFD